jgi:hypothetical protein
MVITDGSRLVAYFTVQHVTISSFAAGGTSLLPDRSPAILRMAWRPDSGEGGSGDQASNVRA